MSSGMERTVGNVPQTAGFLASARPRLHAARAFLPNPNRRSLAFDALVAASILFFDGPQLLDAFRGADSGGHPLIDVLLLASASVPLMWRRKHPIEVLAIVSASNLSWFTITYFSDAAFENFNGGFLALLVSLYSVGLYSASRRRSVFAAAVAIPCVLTTGAFLGEDVAPSIRGFLVNASIVVVFWYVGHMGRIRWDYLEERTKLLELEREDETRRATARERAKIARELHDVVAHSVGLMTLQAGAANLVAHNDPEAALASLSSVEQTGRQALGELRRLLGVLRTDGDERAALTPQPGLGRLDELLVEVERAGIKVRASIEGDLQGLPSALDLSAYRIVQEALTNVVKHAGPSASAEVAVRHGRDQLVLAVWDDGRGVNSTASRIDGGHGLIGMRERTALFGGRISTGPRPEGGFLVRVELPLEPG